MSVTNSYLYILHGPTNIKHIRYSVPHFAGFVACIDGYHICFIFVCLLSLHKKEFLIWTVAGFAHTNVALTEQKILVVAVVLQK